MTQCIIQAIKMRKITYRRENYEIEESPVMSKATLKSSRENSLRSNKEKARYIKLEQKVKQCKDPRITEKLQKKVRRRDGWSLSLN